MAFSGRQVETSFIKETTQGITPAGNLQIFKNTGDSLARISNDVVSEVLDNNRNVEDRRQVSNGANGSIDSELFLENNIPFEESALFAEEISLDNNFPGTTVNAVATGNKYTTDGDFLSLLPILKPYMSIKISGFAGANNNGVKVIKTVSATEMVVFGGDNLTDELAPGVIQYSGERIENGNEQITFSIERKIIGDPTSYYRAYVGMLVNNLTYDIPARDKCTSSFEFLGYEATNPSSTIGTGYTAKTTDKLVDSSHNLKVYVDGSIQAYESLNLAVANNLREQAGVGSEKLIGIGDGIQDVQVSTSLFFENDTEYDKWKNNTTFALTMIFTDDDDNVKVISLPYCKYSDLSEPIEGVDGDVKQSFSIGAIKHPTALYQLSIDNHLVA
jgi:hypothetical protein